GLTDGRLVRPKFVEGIEGEIGEMDGVSGNDASRVGLLSSGRSRDGMVGSDVSLSVSSPGPQELPFIGWPSGQKRVIAPFLPSLSPTAGAVRFAFRNAGSGEHSVELAEHTDANVHVGTRSRLIWMTPPSRVIFAVWPRSVSCVHLLAAQTLAR